jgi:hypothetical protein
MDADFQWKCHPHAESFIQEILNQSTTANQTIAELQDQLLSETSTRLFDWLDHVVILKTEQLLYRLLELGFILQSREFGNEEIYYHPGAQLPRVLLTSENCLEESQKFERGIAVTVDSIADYLMVRGIRHRTIEGSPLSAFRRCLVAFENQTALWVIERRGTLSIQESKNHIDLYDYFDLAEKWKSRSRSILAEQEAFQEAMLLASECVEKLGKDRAACMVLEVERSYWQARNRAGQMQKNRQDRLGMGWANHDHHTFRSSRKHFQQLVQLFESLGFYCRERFYAGKEAGWGAQVMENSVCRLILFLDVDLSPDEINIDFAHQPLPELDQLGTIGLWCALHGDSILKGGMHHLEAQFIFDELTSSLEQTGIGMMSPFSSFTYLKQAFTVGENWSVDPIRVQRLIDEGKITEEQGRHFIQHGAIGSHLENLQRREGYKGFNPNNVSLIIKKTDPRNQ